MSERVPASGTVHWIGTGLSTGSGLRTLCDSADRVVLWARTEERAAACLTRLGLENRAGTAAFVPGGLSARLEPGDVVVSMLPAGEHLALLRLCLDKAAHFACSSYVTAEIAAHEPDTRQIGIVALTEAGLDPGLDHAFAHLLVDQARAAVGSAPVTAELTSYCGGIPAVANRFRYRFSWAPKGVLTALCAPARYVDEGQERTVPRPWEATGPLTVGGETFEVYPNRDSIPFVSQYGIPSSWRLDRFVRGTLRLDGWRSAWAPVFAELEAGDPARIEALAGELAARYPMTERDRDRVVLVVTLSVRSPGGVGWSGEYLLDLVGDERETAMARCVSQPLAIGVADIVAGRTPAGMCRGVENAGDAARLLDRLTEHGIDWRRQPASR